MSNNERSREEIIAMRVRNIIIGIGVLLSICVIALVGTLVFNYMEENEENTFSNTNIKNEQVKNTTLKENNAEENSASDDSEELVNEVEQEDTDVENEEPNTTETSNSAIVEQTGETYKGAELSLENYIVDGENLILKYNLKLDESEEMLVKELWDIATIRYGEETVEFNTLKDFGVFEKVGDTEYTIHKFYTIDTEKINEDTELNSNITIYRYDKEEYYNPTEGEPDLIEVGSWKMIIKLDEEQFGGQQKYALEGVAADFVIEENEVEEGYVINIPTLELNEVIQGKTTTKFNMELINAASNTTYFVEILDEENNVLLEKGLQYFEGNEFAEIVVNRIPDDAKIKIIVYETEAGSGLETYTMSEYLYSTAVIELDMADVVTSE